MSRPLILITNDDGIDSPGISRLASAACSFGDVWVVAPDGQRSGVSHSFSFSSPLVVSSYAFDVPGVRAFSCSGMPADCVKVGVLKLLPRKPDFVFAGINNGPNISADIQYSGTIGAALEASFLGVHAIAFSEQSSSETEVTSRYLGELMEEYMGKPLPPDSAWNINFPACSLSSCKGVLRDLSVAQSDFYCDSYDVTELGSGVREYRLVIGRNWSAPEGTDLKAISDNYVSVGIVSNIR